MNLICQLKRDEGCRLEAYRDKKGVWTIGYGHTGPGVCAGLTWTQAEADAALQLDAQEARDDMLHAFPWCAALDPVRQAALQNMVFQMGPGRVGGFRRMLRALQDEHYAEAETHAIDSDWAREDSPLRARRVARQIATGEWQ